MDLVVCKFANNLADLVVCFKGGGSELLKAVGCRFCVRFTTVPNQLRPCNLIGLIRVLTGRTGNGCAIDMLYNYRLFKLSRHVNNEKIGLIVKKTGE